MEVIGSADSKLNDIFNEQIENLAKKLNYKKYDFKITYKFGIGENYLGDIKRATLKGVKQNDEEEILYLILKTPPTDPCVRKEMPLNSIYGREVFAYTVFLPMIEEMQIKYNIAEDMRFKFAKCYTNSTKDHAEVLVFEDLSVKGFKMFDRLISLDREHILMVVTTLARFHGLSFAVKDKLPNESFEELIKYTVQKESFGDRGDESITRMWTSGMSCIEDTEAVKLLDKFGENIIENYFRIANLSDEKVSKYNILTHGDSWINNMLFKYEDSVLKEMVLVDWQIVRYCSPVTDLVYFLFACVDEYLRTQLWDEILDTYYKTLKKYLIAVDCDPNKCYPEKAFYQDIKEFGVYGLIMGMMAIPIFLNNRDDPLSTSDIIGENGFDSGKVKFSDECVTRINGVVRHMIKLNLLSNYV